MSDNNNGEHSYDVTYRSDSDVALIDYCASDLMVVQAARVSTQGSDSVQTTESSGLIDYLLRSRHGSPFESSYFRFLIRTPIFVAREFMRHRVASYSELSGRYRQLHPIFYVPPASRPLIQSGKAGEYNFTPGSMAQSLLVNTTMEDAASRAWLDYRTLLDAGIAREVARMVLPLSVYTDFYVSMNARGLMNFLSLRVKDDAAAYPTYPMTEIDEVARKMEHHLETHMPHTHSSFIKHGRVCP